MQNFLLGKKVKSRFNELYYPAINRDIFEKFESKVIFSNDFKEYLKKDDTLNIYLGSDSGLLVNFLLEQDLPVNSKCIIIELDSILNFLDISIPEKKRKIIEVVSFKDFFDKFSENSIYYEQNNYFINKSSGLELAVFEEYIKFEIDFRKNFSIFNLKYQAIEMRSTFYRKSLENIASSLYPASCLKDKFLGQSCILVAGGPSLDSNIEWIKTQQNKVPIICVSRVAGKLHKAGIIPEIIVTIDPKDDYFDVSVGAFNSPSSILVHSSHTASKFISQWPGKSLYLSTKYPWRSDDIHMPQIGATVGVVALTLAIELGFKQVVFAGLDLCYSKSGSTHASGNIDTLDFSLASGAITVETYAGDLVETQSDFAVEINNVTDIVNKNKDIDFINISINSAKIEGLEYVDISEIKFNKSSNKKEIDYTLSCIPRFDLDFRKENLEIRINDTKKFLQELKDMESYIDKSLQLSLTLDSKMNSQQLDKIQIKLNKLNDKLNSYKEGSTAIKTFGYKEFTKFFVANEYQLDEKAIKNQHYCNAYKKSHTELVNLLESLIENLESRLLECSESPNIDKILSNWDKYNTPGRIIVLESFNKKAFNLISSDKKEDYLNKFKNILTVKPKEVKESNVKGARKKIIYFYESKQFIALKQIVEKLSNIDIPLAKNLYNLGLGFYLESQGKYKESLEQLLKIEPPTELEIKYISILALKLKNYQLAEYCLTQLVDISKDYLPSYADYLKITKKDNEAINAYLDYLDIYPQNIIEWSNLGQYLENLGLMNDSLTVFSKIIELDPSNKLALSKLSRKGE